MLHWLAQTLGAFATINRQGKLELRAYKPKTHIDAYIGAGKRFRGGSICDFESYYSVANYENLVEESVIEVLGTGTGLTYQFGANPLLQYTNDVPAVFSDIAQYLFDTIHYTPFSVDMAACPAYDLGDNVELTDAKPGWSPVGCIMGYSYQFHGAYTIEGYGSNPALTNVMSATDKDLAQLKASGKSNEIQYYTFTNPLGIELGQEYQTVIDIKFGTVKNALAVFQSEIQMYLSTEARITARYRFDNIELEYHPKEDGEEGFHLFHLLYYYNTRGGTLSRLRVDLKVSAGGATIEPSEIQACLWGQGLVATDEWGGEIECADTVEPIDISTTPGAVVPFTEDVQIDLIAPIVINASETVEPVGFGTVPAEIIPFEDALYINKERMKALIWSEVKALGDWGTVNTGYGW
jgi:hypothetical protein